MIKKYNQLTLEQRYKIEALISAEMTQTAIAEIVGVHKCTINREIKRNVPKRGQGAKIYVACNADAKTRYRHKSKKKHMLLTPELKSQMKEWMTIKRYSPELVSAQWSKDQIAGVSHDHLQIYLELQAYKQARK